MESDERQRGSSAKKILFAPLIGLNWVTEHLLTKIFPEQPKVTEDDILSMVDAAGESGVIEDTGVEIINNAFEFEDLSASDVMTHRINIVGLKSDAKLDDVIYVALEEGFSRLPVYEENLDNIIGIIIVKDLLSLIGKNDLSGFSLGDFLRQVEFVPESCSCTGVFKKMKEKKMSMAVIIDEYGGTAGIVTMEDLVEKVMGSIEDEYDEEEDDIVKIGEDKYRIAGESDPEDVLELFGYELPEDHEYETIAGFVTDLLGFIPGGETGENTPHTDYEDLRFVATEIKDSRISQIIVYRKPK
ncbi:MAG: hemolysin family protein [Oscillospiraceae bacterium]|nr:hemolysin family protein [Oscillospiraceae bacterium]